MQQYLEAGRAFEKGLDHKDSDLIDALITDGFITKEGWGKQDTGDLPWKAVSCP